MTLTLETSPLREEHVSGVGAAREDDPLAHLPRPCEGQQPRPTLACKVKIQTAVTGWDTFLHLLRIFGLFRWDATHL